MLNLIKILILFIFFINNVSAENFSLKKIASLSKPWGLSFINELPYDKDEIIMVGDTLHDSEVAEAMNIDCLLVDHGHISRERLEKTDRKVISNLNQVLDSLI